MSAPVQTQPMEISTSSSLVEIMMELRTEARAETAELRQEMEARELRAEAKATELREEMGGGCTKKHGHRRRRMPFPKSSSRPCRRVCLSTLHAAKLLTDEELFTIEDTLADCMEAMSTVLASHPVAEQVVRMTRLSEKMMKDDASFGRQLRRMRASQWSGR